MARALSSRRAQSIAVLSAGAVLLTVGCGRSSSADKGGGASASAAPTAGATSSAAPAGAFGDLGAICKPGTPKPISGVRGITDTTIKIGTLADPGAAAVPGIEQEFFDAADAFSKWCNAAGGINGRKIQVTKRDAKLFEGAQQVINACQSDFMLVGGGNAIDAPDVKPRLACKLGQIPAYAVSPEAASAGLQVTAAPSIPTQYEIGPLRLLAEAFPESKKGLGIGSSNVASLSPQGKKANQAWQGLGYKVSAIQERPPLIDNYRPYLEQLKGAGAVAYDEIQAQDATPEITAMNNIGWNPVFANFSVTFYNQKSVQAAKAVKFPPTYIGLPIVPYELAADYPVLQQVKAQLQAAVSKPQYDNFSSLAYIAWTLWAKSASECGDNLSQDCILQKAATYTGWTGGGLSSPISTIPGKQRSNPCVVMMRLTPDGFVYDKKVTNPTKGIFNCDPRNTAKVDSFGT
jgi:ABC-type branched-subunit amino acid transport system substrate-binding protein